MRYHNITKDDMLNGDGLRVVLWVSGCEHGCEGCHNPITWDPQKGLLFDENAKNELFSELSKPYISGITFSGGDPLHKNNREEIHELIMQIHDHFPDKTIWLYTGYLWEEICSLSFIQYVDVLIDGKFVQRLKNDKLHWRGSSNQKIIDVKRSLEQRTIIEYQTDKGERA